MLAALVLCAAYGAAAGEPIAPTASTLLLPPDIRDTVFPGAERTELTGKAPTAWRVVIAGKPAGFIVSTDAVVRSTGYGGGPIDIVIGVRNNGTITGAYLRHHSEPILVLGISDSDLQKFVAGFKGLNVLSPAVKRRDPQSGAPDAIAGASVSSAVIEDAIVRSARIVLRAYTGGSQGASLKLRPFKSADWKELLGSGAIQHKAFSFAQATAGAPAGVDPSGLFIDMYLALLTPPMIGGNLLGERDQQQLMSGQGAKDNAILIAADGFYSFKGRSYRQDGVFDRVQIVQGARTIGLSAPFYKNVEHLKAAGAPEFREIARFVVPAVSGFDPTRPWRIDLFVRDGNDNRNAARAVLQITYHLPEEFIDMPTDIAASDTEGIGSANLPLWRSFWLARSGTIAGLLFLLSVLAAILVWQDKLVAYRRFRDIGRLAYLGIVLVWLGWYAGGQLSVLQVLTFAHAFMTGFQWEHFLIDPVIFILWGFVAVTLLLWGRGVYCGWLCPFGALQELVNSAARRLKVPQIQVPFTLHERLWAIKYIAFIGLFAVSLHGIREAIVFAEIEPFKTAISLKFTRSWPFVAYVAGIIAIGLFIERFFCRYLCPLGAALAIPARLRTFNWLKRRHQCGSECQICSERCTVQAIHPTGEINPNECIHCLECQTYYFDDHICPPLVTQRKRRERRAALANGIDISKEANDGA